MLPFNLKLKLGEPPYKQIIFAAQKAIITGVLKHGDCFPSVRVISKELKINPNTVQKAITQLVQQGMLEICPGIGTKVCHTPRGNLQQKSHLLTENLEPIIIEAKRLGVSKEELLEAINKSWKKL